MTKPTPEPELTPWQKLSAIDVNAKTEKKNGLTYLSWAWAWGELKQAYPYAWFRKHENGAGFPCFYDVQGYAFVKVTVGLDRTGDHEVTELLPVLDHRNKPIQGPNAFDVNNALQRCLTKAIAYLGLGHYIYAGEDVPGYAPQTSPEGGAEASVGTTTLAHPGSLPAPDGVAGAVDSRGPTVFYPAGDGYVQNTSADIIAATFLAFIPVCTGNEELTRFYATNKGARDYLLATNPDLHKKVLDAFSDAKRKLAPPGKEITTLKPQENQ